MDNPVRAVILRPMDTDIIIVGGGLNGPALALAAAQAGFAVTIIDSLPIDQRKQPDFDGRSYALALSSKHLLKGIDVWGAVADHAQPMLEIKVTDGVAGKGASPWMLHFDHAEIEEGPMGFMVEDRHLRRAFLDAMAAAPLITQMSEETVISQDITPSTAQVTLASGKTVTGSVLIGSDGRRSGTAERAGIKRTGWGYGQTAVVCAVAHEKPNGGIAHQFFMPAGPLAILPLTENRSSIVWSETDARATELAAMNDADFLDALRPAFGSFLGQISLTGARFNYPLGLTLANSFIADRMALIGDAAHGMHPIAGQGLNAGLRDVAALVEVLSDARARGEDIGGPQVLQRYQQWRRFDTATLALATDTFNRLFSNDNPVLRGLRDIGMGVVNGMPGLRRSFIREAAGLSGDLPKLMQG
ncbi:UbiH/UbiF/VisC/COQ6 family ubiquinone biosynthesis hydroxylase [Yoonia sp. I 8.24]|uniref:UbiH/UbiF/VisC/COQ6 family ubiquinone biosynthesis hydroxylase n=1 Tax=Yoonia sp. I 8.24 TaxID=1537229 RepID=UPI001EDD6890|nr:UbiH/UbiF/VisC/COQ6 family ubiquinone biosynthesis hydroxylase [Yoonia sp. I 8.24]MCG3269235.1 UbiH/UbiF/VisC/COQ6 family ubiquinone biosynthesis hydroxylase [Yoonia sp. I 8.24]